jgi:hypothetical protein
MSIKYKKDFACPECGRMNTVMLWESINVQLDPEARKDILAGKLHKCHCSECGNTFRIDITFLYHDMQNHFMVWYFPLLNIEEPDFFDQFEADGSLNLWEGLASAEKEDYTSNIHYVFSLDELERYILFRERLAQREGSFRKVNCFSCGSSIDLDQNYFCVQRLLLSRGEDKNPAKDKVLNATTAIQTCSGCLEEASTKKIDIKERPLPLLQLEQDGFFEFARQFADGNPITNAKSGNCTLCKVPINTGDNYIRIEITEELIEEGSVKVEKVHILGVLCQTCTSQYAWGSMEGI